jgi:hypothetical protein
MTILNGFTGYLSPGTKRESLPACEACDNQRENDFSVIIFMTDGGTCMQGDYWAVRS